METSTTNSPTIPSLPYKIAIIGGGPAGIAILIRAIRLGMLAELCGTTSTSSGIVIIDKDNENRFGGGKLQDYEINSNTFGDQFYTHILTDRKNCNLPEFATDTILEPLRNASSGKYLSGFSNKEVPLKKVGEFLVDVGKTIHTAIKEYRACKCLFETECTKIQRCGNNWKINLLNNKTIIDENNTLPKLPSHYHILAEVVVLATGGIQQSPLFTIPMVNHKIMTSDYLCTTPGIQDLSQRLEKSNKKKHKIIIIGGSHSSFSSAWICLNQLTTTLTHPEAISPSLSIYIIHRGPIKVFYNTRKEALQDNYKLLSNMNRHGQINPFCGLRGDAKKLYQNIVIGKESRVRLLPIRQSIDNTFVSSSNLMKKLFNDASVIVWSCGYSSNMMPIVNEVGKPYAIRKMNGQVEVDDQARILIDTTTSSSNSNSNSNTVDILSSTPLSNSLPNTTPPGTTPSNSANAVTTEICPLPGLYGTGLGFGLAPEAVFISAIQSNHKLSSSLTTGNNLTSSVRGRVSERADGVSVYLKRAATLILASVLGPKVFGEGASSWEQRKEINLAQRQQQLLAATRAASTTSPPPPPYSEVDPAINSATGGGGGGGSPSKDNTMKKQSINYDALKQQQRETMIRLSTKTNKGLDNASYSFNDNKSERSPIATKSLRLEDRPKTINPTSSNINRLFHSNTSSKNSETSKPINSSSGSNNGNNSGNNTVVKAVEETKKTAAIQSDKSITNPLPSPKLSLSPSLKKSLSPSPSPTIQPPPPMSLPQTLSLSDSAQDSLDQLQLQHAGSSYSKHQLGLKEGGSDAQLSVPIVVVTPRNNVNLRTIFNTPNYSTETALTTTATTTATSSLSTSDAMTVNSPKSLPTDYVMKTSMAYVLEDSRRFIPPMESSSFESDELGLLIRQAALHSPTGGLTSPYPFPFTSPTPVQLQRDNTTTSNTNYTNNKRNVIGRYSVEMSPDGIHQKEMRQITEVFRTSADRYNKSPTHQRRGSHNVTTTVFTGNRNLPRTIEPIKKGLSFTIESQLQQQQYSAVIKGLRGTSIKNPKGRATSADKRASAKPNIFR